MHANQHGTGKKWHYFQKSRKKWHHFNGATVSQGLGKSGTTENGATFAFNSGKNGTISFHRLGNDSPAVHLALLGR